MTMKEHYDRWCVLIAKPEITTGEYPPYLEFRVQDAVQLKRNKRYEEAIEIYLYLLERTNACYYDLLVSMYKSVLSSGHFYFAYEVIAMAEVLVKQKVGMKPAPHPLLPFLDPGPWRQTELRRELEELMLRHQNFRAVRNTNDGDFEYTMRDLTDVIKPYSGQDDYALPDGTGVETQAYIQGTLERMEDWHKKYKKYLDR